MKSIEFVPGNIKAKHTQFDQENYQFLVNIYICKK